MWIPSSEFFPLQFGTTLAAPQAHAKELLQRQAGLQVDPSRPLVGFVGRLEDQKGVDILLTALPSILPPRPERPVGPLRLTSDPVSIGQCSRCRHSSPSPAISPALTPVLPGPPMLPGGRRGILRLPDRRQWQPCRNPSGVARWGAVRPGGHPGQGQPGARGASRWPLGGLLDPGSSSGSPAARSDPWCLPCRFR